MKVLSSFTVFNSQDIVADMHKGFVFSSYTEMMQINCLFLSLMNEVASDLLSLFTVSVVQFSPRL